MKLLTRELAQKIVERTMGIINRNINVMNEKGIIIGSGDSSRINQVHAGAVAVIERGDIVEIDEEEAQFLKGAKPGVNLPIYFKNEIVGVVGITGKPEKVRGFGLLIKMAAEMILDQAFLMEQIQWDERLKEEILHQLITGENTSDPWFKERAKTLGIDLDVPRIVVILELRSNSLTEEALSKKRKKVVSILKSLIEPEDLLTLAYTTEIILLKKIRLKGLETDKDHLFQQLNVWKSRLYHSAKVKIKIGIGTYYQDFKELAQSYDEAKKTLKVGLTLYPDQDIYWYNEMGFPILIQQISAMNNHPLLEHFKKIVYRDKKGELQQTLKVFIEENGEINKTAERLFIHRNTLHYRLDKMKEITGKDPKKLNELIELYTSMLIHTLRNN
ncbi:sugar diacid recognition domain-containing protein [Tepidibacillus fermentans]|uniref:Carbohydrate diacid regulator n=1 Tax=Tepidibacillus fermentans TaxID=1281767 RepID=A0A4R3KL19_9BACI|nr:sugar diacid recognition domain-containing protein [Tepidibacillus fermentans]TCS84200.1 carbohydrate diacid regulator [Tepidibacillus fermentans]